MSTNGRNRAEIRKLIILGIDPGLQKTGYGVIASENGDATVIEAGVVSTNPKDELASRLHEIFTGLGAVISQFHPDLMAVEDLYAHYNHPRTAIVMGHARAMVFLQSAQAGLPLEVYASTKVKSALTGNGRASKEQMQSMVKSVLGLDRLPSPADAADALAVALCHHSVINTHAASVFDTAGRRVSRPARVSADEFVSEDA